MAIQTKEISQVEMPDGDNLAEYKIGAIFADPELQDDDSPESRYYEAADRRRLLMDQYDAVTVILDRNPTLDHKADRGLGLIDAFRIAATIDNDLKEASTKKELIDGLMWKFAETDRVLGDILKEMKDYPNDVKKDIFPGLEAWYKDLDKRCEALCNDRAAERKRLGQPTKSTTRSLIKTEQVLNDVYALMKAHEAG